MQLWQWLVLAVPALVLLVSIIMIARILSKGGRSTESHEAPTAPREEVPPVSAGDPHQRRDDDLAGDLMGDRLEPNAAVDDESAASAPPEKGDSSTFARPVAGSDDSTVDDNSSNAPDGREKVLTPVSADEVAGADHALTGKDAVIEASGAKPRNAAD